MLLTSKELGYELFLQLQFDFPYLEIQLFHLQLNVKCGSVS